METVIPEPITREEQYLAAAAGYNITPPEPITRKEIFLAKLAGMDVETPAMFTRDELFIASAAERASTVVIEPLEITENGTYTAPSGVAGYNPVTVNVAGSSAELRYVTFMSYDGSFEYGKKAVAVGDDCADPIARGIFVKPTRESDAQYNYTFYGWATTPNGAADSNALKAVTEDRTLYANFSAAVRYYTITYYDSDGTTVLKTESLAYGAMPSYAPTKENVVFGGWNPATVAVTGNANYTVVWEEKLTFASGSWEKIAEICAAGSQAAYFAVGDTRTETLAYEDGTTENVTLEIVDINSNSIVSGTKMALLASHALATPMAMFNTTPSSLYYTYSDLLKYLNNTLTSCFTSDFQEVMKNVSQPYASGYSKVHVPTANMLIGHGQLYSSPTPTVTNSDKLKAFRDGKSKICKTADGTNVSWWTASTGTTSATGTYRSASIINENGSFVSAKSTDKYYIRPLIFI